MAHVPKPNSASFSGHFFLERSFYWGGVQIQCTMGSFPSTKFIPPQNEYLLIICVELTLHVDMFAFCFLPLHHEIFLCH